jgi:hypothetical protein
MIIDEDMAMYSFEFVTIYRYHMQEGRLTHSSRALAMYTGTGWYCEVTRWLHRNLSAASKMDVLVDIAIQHDR